MNSWASRPGPRSPPAIRSPTEGRLSLFDPPPIDEPTAPSGPSVRVRLQIAYDGRQFHGFAAQAAGVRTVSGVLSGAIGRVLRLPESPRLTCAGRTDAGVHAWDQWAHFDVPSPGPDLADLHRRLIKLLAPEVVVRQVDLAAPDWDARFSAVSRTYRYTVLTAAVPDPFRAGFVWWRPGELDIRSMQLACDALIGSHDFSAFCRRPPEPGSLVRTVLAAGWSCPAPDTAVFEVTANAFCQQMVRALVGTLVEIGTGRRKAGDMLAVIRSLDRAQAGAVAPPDGLVLYQVTYP